ncbi:LacI family DNA-binding transcriptional regulator [Herbiconiux sp. KACC 21604]|uniref:LacI family DNA-binding transcriptional regulator n=1 Tax=unclassified Herbiconiux TaxID=2618217 RepID=UPI0014912C5B|nr:LacI family DNA-binding transcriptional regulator [Herbiconiux sp. SALV-R1]QJU54894.1 LacI family DNA-binding transcriptional regulator [Herbiconiux sp. SALV-R1]WPO86018.1 LacI family DNA-binding transcriptional regulator [Herbiconiux sp. KACC 21604]
MASIQDVARAAGVSISTVSYALSGKRTIAAATRDRIDAAVAELGYRPNAGARMLAGSRTNLLALSAPLHADTYAPAHMTFVLAIAEAAREFDYDTVLLVQDEAVNGLRRMVSSKLVDGIVLLDVDRDDTRVPLVRELDIPVTLVGIPGDTTGLTCVDLDFESAACLSVERLVAQGHRQIGLIGHPSELYERGSNFPIRFRDAFATAAADFGVDTLFVMPEQDPASVKAAVDELRATLPGLSALVLNCNEPVHTMLLELLRKEGLSIPADLSIVSACSSFPTDQLDPPLDVIPLPALVTGRRGVELTMRQLTGSAEPVVELVPPSYIAKGSTAPVA